MSTLLCDFHVFIMFNNNLFLTVILMWYLPLLVFVCMRQINCY